MSRYPLGTPHVIPGRDPMDRSVSAGDHAILTGKATLSSSTPATDDAKAPTVPHDAPSPTKFTADATKDAPAKDRKASARIPGSPKPSPEPEVIQDQTDWKAKYMTEKREDTDTIVELRGLMNEDSALLSFAEGKIVALATTKESQHQAFIHYITQSVCQQDH